MKDQNNTEKMKKLNLVEISILCSIDDKVAPTMHIAVVAWHK